MPYLINVVDTEYKHRAFALKTAAWSLAGFAGSLVGGVLPGFIATLNATTLADPAPYRSTLIVAGGILALSALGTLRIRPLPKAAKPAPTDSPAPALRELNWKTSLIVSGRYDDLHSPVFRWQVQLPR